MNGVAEAYPVKIHVEPPLRVRNRLTVLFRIFLALPHIILVGGPIAVALSWGWSTDSGMDYDWGAGGGVLGAVTALCGVIAWFAIVFTGKHPAGLWDLAVYYLRWRVRAVAYMALFRDEYPPFGDGSYAAALDLPRPAEPRDRVTVGFRLILAIPHIFAVWLLGAAWCATTVIAWFVILFTGEYPDGLYQFGMGVFRWSTRAEAYLLLLTDEYPPFSLE